MAILDQGERLGLECIKLFEEEKFGKYSGLPSGSRGWGPGGGALRILAYWGHTQNRGMPHPPRSSGSRLGHLVLHFDRLSWRHLVANVGFFT